MARETYVKTSVGTWEQIASTVMAVPQGLVPIVPTSVAGTGVSYSGNGIITATGSTSITVNGIFSAAYTNYRIIVSTTGSSVPTNKSTLRFTTAGTVNTTTNYTWAHAFVQGTSTGVAGQTTAVTSMTTPFFNDMILEVYSPFSSSRATMVNVNSVYAGTNFYGQAGFNLSTSFDGFQLTNNTFDVTIQVYGYSKGGLNQPQTITPYSMAAGNTTVTGTGATTASATVTFPTGRFSVAPIVTTSFTQGTIYISNANSITSTGFTMVLRDRNDGAISGAATTNWQAVQMLSSAASG